MCQFIGEIKMVDGPSCPLGEGFRVRYKKAPLTIAENGAPHMRKL